MGPVFFKVFFVFAGECIRFSYLVQMDQFPKSNLTRLRSNLIPNNKGRKQLREKELLPFQEVKKKVKQINKILTLF